MNGMTYGSPEKARLPREDEKCPLTIMILFNRSRESDPGRPSKALGLMGRIIEPGPSCQHVFGRVSGAERAPNIMSIVQDGPGFSFRARNDI